MGTFESFQNKQAASPSQETRVFRKEIRESAESSVERAYVPPKFVTNTLREHGITYDSTKHRVFTAPGTTEFFLQNKGSSAIIPFEAARSSQLEEQPTPIMENNQPSQPQVPEIPKAPDMASLGEAYEKAVSEEKQVDPAIPMGQPLPAPITPAFPEKPAAEMPRIVMPEIPVTLPETKGSLEGTSPAQKLETLFSAREAALSPEQKKQYDALTTWWGAMPESTRNIVSTVLIEGALGKGT